MNGRRTSILDVFNEVAGFQNQMMGAVSGAHRDEAEPWLRNLQPEIEVAMSNIERDSPFNWDGDPDDEEGLEKYTQKYIFNLENKAMAWLGGKLKGREGNPYFRRGAEQMQAGALAAARGAALKKQDEWRIGREDINRGEDINAYISCGVESGWSPGKIMEAVFRRLDLSAGRRPITAQQMHEMRQAYGKEAYERYVASSLAAEEDVENLQRRMGEIRKEWAEAMGATSHAVPGAGGAAAAGGGKAGSAEDGGFSAGGDEEPDEALGAAGRAYNEAESFFQKAEERYANKSEILTAAEQKLEEA